MLSKTRRSSRNKKDQEQDKGEGVVVNKAALLTSAYGCGGRERGRVGRV